jgi:hypothetical protein
MDAIAKGEPNKRGFTYLMLGGMRVAMATSGRVAVLKLLGALSHGSGSLLSSTVQWLCVSNLRALVCLMVAGGGEGGGRGALQ